MRSWPPRLTGDDHVARECLSRQNPFVVRVDDNPTEENVFYSQAYQMYEHERSHSAADQRATDIRIGEAAAARRAAGLRLGRVRRLTRRPRPACGDTAAPRFVPTGQ